jgi:hypothetical protein
MSSLNFKGIYVIQTRECVDANNNIYKIGQSKNIGKALQKYPNGSKVFYIIECLEPIKYKNKIIKLLKNNSILELNSKKDFVNCHIYTITNFVHDYLFLVNTTFRICKTPFIIKTVDENNKYILPKDRDINNVVCETIDYENLTSQILDVIDNNLNRNKKLYRIMIETLNICKNEQNINTKDLEKLQNLSINFYSTIVDLQNMKNEIDS